MLSLILLGFGSAVLAQQAIGQEFAFDIPQQAVDTALTEFAEQADLTLVFPDEVVRKKSANALIGKYTLQEGIDILLAGTGLTPRFSDHIVLSISAGQQLTNKGNTMNMQKKVPLLKRIGTVIATALFATSGGAAIAAPGLAAEGDGKSEQQDDSKYIEEIIVAGERGETSSLDRAMTVTGFNGAMIEQLGIQNTDDLEVLVPGLQKGARSTMGKYEDGHLVMRGVANDNHMYNFQDTSVAVYVDGIYNPRSYGLESGLFDVERIEVARGPQGTTGGKTAMAGAVTFVSKKPTDEWDIKAAAEFTDQASQQVDIAFGGPIGNSPFSYRLAVNRLTGDGLIKNVGAGPDAGKPDRFQYAPQIRFKTDRWDITGCYRNLEDTGVHKFSLAIGARNTEEEFFRNLDGTRRCEFDQATNECIRDANGNIVYWRNPFFGLGQSPAIVNCPGFNSDGTRDPGLPVVCDGKHLTLATEFNVPAGEDNSQETYSLEAKFALNDTHDIFYFYGDRDTRTDTTDELDGTSRQGGGRCLAIHPRVLSGELQEGQVHPRCALDERGNGVYQDSKHKLLRTSDQQSHEIRLVSNNDGPLNYTIGYTYLKGDQPYVNLLQFNGVETGSNNNNNPAFYTDTVDECERTIRAYFGEDTLWEDISTQGTPDNQAAAGLVWGCHGADYAAFWSHVTNGPGHIIGGSTRSAFYGNTAYEQAAF